MIAYFVLAVWITTTEAARILAVFPTPSISHQVVFRPITQELARRGHEVIVITPDPAFTKETLPPNLTEIDVHDISYQKWQKEFMTLKMGADEDFSAHASFILKLLVKLFEEQMKVKEVEDLLKSNQFDLLLLEDCVRPTLALSHIFKSPVIKISSFGAMFGTYEAAGIPSHPIVYPSIFNTKFINLTTWEKCMQFYKYYNMDHLFKSLEYEENEMIKGLFGRSYNIPPLSILYKNVDMFFLNVDPAWANNQPVPPNIVYIGGIHQTPRKALLEDLKSYLDSSKYGVIYVSFGTNVRSAHVPLNIVNAMVTVFGQVKYDIIWKWEENRTDTPSNVKIYKWLPQADLLRHPKVKLFITQGGLQSTQEAISAGVPLIGIPSFGDQWYNVEKYVYHKIGIKLEMGLLTEDSLKLSIDSVIEDVSYRNNIVKLRNVMADQPQSPLERAIWWTEYVLRHGGAKHLRSPAAGMSVAEYYELRLVGLIAMTLLVLIIITYTIVRYTSIKAFYSYRCYLNYLIERRKNKKVN